MSRKKPISELHSQYVVQSLWTEPTRNYLLSLAGAQSKSRILEVGCGTGVILQDVRKKYTLTSFGIDIDFSCLLFAQNEQCFDRLALADVQHLPFPDQSFDITFCHYFLLWVHDKNRTLQEMIRVTRLGGAVIAFAEPDHRARIDYPANLEEIGRLQNLSLINQGADITAGRKLAQLFNTNGLSNVIVGIYGNEFRGENVLEAHNFEWNYLKDDLSIWLDAEQISNLIELDRQARINYQRILYIPTFWAIGWVSNVS
jgi:ubiquinone/menaquinone biosynthesis C-methylase UbiE